MTGREVDRVAERIRLITSAGIKPYDPVQWGWEGKSVAAVYPCVALVQLLELEQGEATILLTQEAAATHWPAVAQALADVGWRAERRIISPGQTLAEQMEIADTVMEAVQPGEAVLLDVTSGLRNLPFAYLAALTYLAGLQGNRLQGIYYAAYELKDADPRPIFDLTPLFRLIEWYQVLGAGRLTGDLRPVAQALARDKGELFRRGERPHAFAQASDAVTRLAQALAAGLPVETGIEATRAVEALEALETDQVPWPPARRVLAWWRRELVEGRWGTPVPPEAASGKDRKKQVPLTVDELRRQLALARWYTERYDFVKAALLLREWLVSVAVLAWGTPANWLAPEERKAAARRVNGLRYQMQVGMNPSTAAGVLGELMEKVAGIRNRLAHAGMQLEEVSPGGFTDDLTDLLKQCEAVLDRLPELASAPVLEGGRILVSPLGFSPGALYTALRRYRPDRLMVVTSREALGALEDVLQRADRSDISCQSLLLDDPLAGVNGLAGLVNQEVRQWLVGAQEVAGNLTGGTTLMQHAVERLVEEARRLGTEARRCFVIDRRPPEVQRAEPYVEGELLCLDR